MKSKSGSWKILFLGILVVMAGYLDWCLLTIAYKNSIIYGLAFGGNVLAWLLYGKMYFEITPYKKEHGQLCIVNIIFGLCNFAILLFSLIRKTNDINIWIVLIHMGWIIVCLALFLLFDKKKYGIFVCDAWKGMQCSKGTVIGAIVLVLVISGLALDRDMLQFKWDGLLYYKTCTDLSLYSISNLAIYGHIAQTYGGLVRIAVLLFGNTATAMIVMNIVLLLCGTTAFYKTLKILLPKLDKLMCLLGTLIFAFSPFCLGMVNYHNLDFYLQCIFPIVIYFTLTRQWIFQLVSAILFCFTKEPAVMIYGGFCLGVVLADLLKNAESSWVNKIKCIIATKHYYSMALPGVLWIGTYLLLGPWSAGEGGAALEFEYMLEKLKVLYVFNFNWLLVLLIITAFIKSVISKEKKQGWGEAVIPLLTSQVLFTVFSCCFKTVNHPRYADSNVVTLSLLAVLSISYLLHKKSAYVIMGLVSVIMLVSSFWTVDSVSKKCFNTVDIGNTEMITTMTPFLGDGMIYNKQMLWLENVMNQAFADVLEDSSYVLIPALEDSTYFFDGMAEVSDVEDGFQIDTYYWRDGKREYYASEDALELRCIQISDKVNLDELKEQTVQEYIDFLYLDSIEKEYFDEFIRENTILEKESYQYRGWKLNRVRIQL